MQTKGSLHCTGVPATRPAHAEARASDPQVSIDRFSFAFIDKRGNPVLIRPYSEHWKDRLIHMYLDFDTDDRFCGLPPVRPEACVKWVEHIICNGVSLLALSFEDGVVGHAAIFPMQDRRCEMFIVCRRSHQNIGIGTQLTRAIVELAYELDFDDIWLSVDVENLIAQHVYTKRGFEFISHAQTDEVDMTIDLKRYYDMAGLTVGDVMNRSVITIRESQTCQDALELFVKRQVGALPVVDEHGRVVGILSETDLILVGSFEQKVSTLCTKQVITVRPDSRLAKVVRLFHSKKIRCVPVVSGAEKLVGIVARRDILAFYLAENQVARVLHRARSRQ
jgi:CBS domain-containing protein